MLAQCPLPGELVRPLFNGPLEIESENVRFTLGSGHSANIGEKVRYRPKADIFPHVDDTAAR